MGVHADEYRGVFAEEKKFICIEDIGIAVEEGSAVDEGIDIAVDERSVDISMMAVLDQTPVSNRFDAILTVYFDDMKTWKRCLTGTVGDIKLAHATPIPVVLYPGHSGKEFRTSTFIETL